MAGTSQNNSAQSVPPIVDLHDLWRFKWRIAVTAAVFVAIAAGYISITPTTYEVSTRVWVREDDPAIELNPVLADREFLATQAEVIRSPLIVAESLQHTKVSVPATYQNGEVAYVLENLVVIPIIQTDVLKISYRSQDAAEAKRVVAALVSEYEARVQQEDRSRHADELELLARQETDLREQLDVLLQQHAKFRQSSPLIGQSRETLTVMSNQHTELAQRLSEARSRRMALEHKLGAYAVAKKEMQGDKIAVIPASLVTDGEGHRRPNVPTTGPSNASNDTDPSTNVLRDISNADGEDFKEIQLQLWQARVLHKSLSAKYTAEHPAMAGAEEQVQYWEDLLQDRVHAAEVGLSHELDAARTTERNLQDLFENEQSHVKQLDDFLVEEETMVARITRAEESHALALARLKEFQLTEAALQQGRSSVVVQPLDGPELQEEIIWPQPKILLGLSGVLGLVAGVILVSMKRS